MGGNSLVVYDQAAQKEICGLLGISGSANHITLLFKLAEHYQLDVLTKEIALIPNKGPFIGVWGRLHIAHRSGRLDGLEADDEYETDKHHCVRCVVWRNDMGHPAAKVIGRVAKADKKDWPMEIARARALRAALGYAFSIHDSFDDASDGDDWTPAPDERIQADIVAAGPGEEVRTGEPAAAPKPQRRVNRSTGEVQVVESEPSSGAAAGPKANDQHVPNRPAAPETEPATIIVGGHSLAQRLAIAARDAGIDDDQTRHDVIRAATNGTYQRGSDVPEDAPAKVTDRLFDAFTGLKNGTVELRYPDGTPKLFKVRQ